MALTLYRPLFWIVLVLMALALVWLAVRRRLRWWPAWLLRLLLLALVLFSIFSPQSLLPQALPPQPTVMVVDQSDSLSVDTRTQLQQLALAWRNGGAGRVLISFGDQASVVAGDAWPVVDGRSSDITAALRLADEALGSAPGKVILVSDGLATDPAGVEALVKGWAARQHILEVLPLQPRSDSADGAVGRPSAPSVAWEGIPFDVVLPVYLPAAGAAPKFEVKVNEQVVNIPAQPLAGSSNYLFHIPGQAKGIVTLAITAAFANDPFPQNNQAFTTLSVFAPPKILFITAEPDQAQRFVSALSSYGLQVTVKAPPDLPSDSAGLADYQVIFLHDLPAYELTDAQTLNLQTFVTKQAGGLIFLGGLYSYSLGGYQNTLLENMLPVKMEPPLRSQRPPIAMLLMLDDSGSMGTPISLDTNIAPIDLEREAAMRVIESMKPDDTIGVFTYSTDFNWDVPLHTLGSGLSQRQALDAVSQITSLNGTNMYAAMQEAVDKLSALPPSAPQGRYMLILSDGKSFDGSLDEFKVLATAASQKGITISTIALGSDVDRELMSTIAQLGKGRYYEVPDATQLPRIMFSASLAAHSESLQQGKTTLKEGQPQHPVLSGLSTSLLPGLNAYNAQASKVDQGAEDILVSANFGDPILSAWQYGLGRVVAWMSDIGEAWTDAWSSPALEGQFWSQVVRYSLANPALGPVQVDVTAGNTGLSVDASIRDALDNPTHLYQVTFSYVEADGKVHSFYVPWSGPGVYHLDLARPPEGAYRAVLAYQAGDGVPQEVAAPFAISPPLEWLPADAAQGQANLSAWAKLTGGQVTSLDAVLAVQKPTPEPSNPLEKNTVWLLFILLASWPVEIFIRRRWLPWQ